MATDIITEIIVNGTVQSPDIALNPWFDQDTIIGIPIWVWLLVACIIILIITQFYWLWRRRIMSGVSGYVEAMKYAGTTPDGYQIIPVLLFAKTKMFQIFSLNYKDAVLSFKDDIANVSKWLHTSKLAVGRLGGLQCLFASDDLDTTRDFVAELALCQAVEDYNTEQKNPDNMITNYREFLQKRQTLEHGNPTGIKMLAYQLFDLKKVDRLIPRGRPAGLWGGLLLEEARNYKPQKPLESGWDKLWGALSSPLGMVFISGMIGNIFLYIFLKR